MIQDQIFREQQQNILNNPQSLQMIKQNLNLLINNDYDQLQHSISHLQNYLSSCLHNHQSSCQTTLSQSNSYFLQIKQRISQKSTNYSSIIKLCIRLINYIVELRIKSQNINQNYEYQIDRLQNTIQQLTNKNTYLQIDIQNWKEKLQHAKQQILEIVKQKNYVQQKYKYEDKCFSYQKDKKIMLLQKDLEDIKMNISLFKDKINNIDNDVRNKNNEYFNERFLNGQVQGDDIFDTDFTDCPNNQKQMVNQQIIQQNQQYNQYLQQQNHNLKQQINALKAQLNKNIFDMNTILNNSPKKTQSSNKSIIKQIGNQQKSDFKEKTRSRCHTQHKETTYVKTCHRIQQNINTFLQLLRIKDDDKSSLKRNLSRQSLKHLTNVNQQQKVPHFNSQLLQNDINQISQFKMHLHGHEEDKNQIGDIRIQKDNNEHHNNKALIYLTQQQQNQNDDKQKYSWFFKEQQIPYESSCNDKTESDKSYSSIGVNTMASSINQYISGQKNNQEKIMRKQNNKKCQNNVTKTDKKVESKSYFDVVCDYVVKRRIRRKTTLFSIQKNQI